MKLGFPLLFVLILSFTASNVFLQEKPADFRKVIEQKFAKYELEKVVNGKLQKKVGIELEQVCPIDKSLVAKRVFAEYGAIFIAQNGVRIPPACIFDNDQSVFNFQQLANPTTKVIGKISITLQKPAMEDLLKARDSAAKLGLMITPNGKTASSRSFTETLKLWNSRVDPALKHWVKQRKISRQEEANFKTRSLQEQITKVLEWEEKGFYFSTYLNKTILQSVAIPGASQHIFLLALDIHQYTKPRVRAILAENGWFQTVKSDLPHFTYLGIKETDVSKRENELKKLGLKKVKSDGQEFWIPNL